MELVARDMRVKQSINANSQTIAEIALCFTDFRISIGGW